MKLQATQENLNKALSTVSRVASGRNTLPVLANVLIKTESNRLCFMATNLDIAITHYIGAKISNEGSITVPARLMQDFIASLPAGVVDLELEKTKLNINTKHYQSTINGVVADDFPVMPIISGGVKWKIDAKNLKQALSQVVFAASSDETRPALTGALIFSQDGQLFIAATDSYRLAEKKLGGQKQDIKLLVPATALQDVLRILGDFNGEVGVTHNDQQVLFTIGDVELVARLLEGNYPDYQKLIPSKFSVSAELKRADILSVTKVSSLFARESAGSVTVNLDEAKKSLSIHSIASQLGENTAEAEAKVHGNGSITINSRYLIDALNALEGDEVTFSFNGKLEPILVKGTGSDYTHIIMPLKS